MEGLANLPYSGIATFCKAPWVAREADWQADVAVLGAPYDWGVGYRPGARMAPRALRDASTRYALGPEGYFDVEDGRTKLKGVRLVDTGDVDVLYLNTVETFDRISQAVGQIASRGARPLLLGGDHSVTFPAFRGLAQLFAPGGPHAGKRLHLVQLDAHLDFRDQLLGVTLANSSPVRRLSELPFAGQIVCLGIRGLRTSPRDYVEAQARGNRMVLARDIRRTSAREGEEALTRFLEPVPPGEPIYVTIDIDGLDPALAPGTGSPEPDGLTYAEAKWLLRAAATRGPVVGFDLVEVSPPLDPTGRTQLVGVALLLELLGGVFG